MTAAVLSALTVPSAANAENWKRVAEDSQGFVGSVDVDSIVRTEPIDPVRPFPTTQMRLKLDMPARNGQPAASVLTLVSFDCSGVRHLRLSSTVRSIEGKEIGTQTFKDEGAAYAPVIKGSKMEAAFTIACGSETV